MVRFDREEGSPPPAAKEPRQAKPAPQPPAQPKPAPPATPAAALQAKPPALPSTLFDGQKYIFSRAYKDGAGALINEYLPPGESAQSNWEQRITLISFAGLNVTPGSVARSLADNLQKANPAARYSIEDNGVPGVVMVDFFSWTQGNKVIEFNAFKISRSDGITTALQYTRRWYDAQADFLATFKTQRPRWLDELRYAPFPPQYKQQGDN